MRLTELRYNAEAHKHSLYRCIDANVDTKREQEMRSKAHKYSLYRCISTLYQSLVSRYRSDTTQNDFDTDTSQSRRETSHVERTPRRRRLHFVDCER
jgi:hypothetical protein